MARFRLTVRRRGATDHERFGSLDAALAALRVRVDELAGRERRATERALTREYEPVAQVAARVQLAGPGRLRGGVDVRGDGSAEAWTGSWRKRLVEPRPGESACDALGRALTPPA